MPAIRSCALLLLVGGIASACAAARDAAAPSAVPAPTAAQQAREERIVRTPWFVSSDYFRERRGEQPPVLDLPRLQRSREELEARQQAIEERVTRLEAGKSTAGTTGPFGYVVKVRERTIYTDLTAREGAAPGVTLSILSERELSHPISGRVLGQSLEEIGRATVVEVADTFSVAEVVELQAGETIRPKDRVVIRPR